MVSVKVYVEGGGNAHALKVACRHNFKEFFEKAGFAGRLPRVVACGARNTARGDFETAILNGEAAVLLVESEGPVEADSPWAHLRARDGWEQPGGATDEQCHLMVQCMEHWFLADKEALGVFFGPKFRPQSLPKNLDVEQVSKADVYKGLAKATKDTQKGPYGKGRHSFKILGLIDPAKVRQAAPYAERLLSYLNRVL